MDKNIFNVAIIGLGNIGMGYDSCLDETNFVLSHARAFSQSPNFNLVLGIEKEPKLREIFSKSFSVDTVEKIGDYQGVTEIDLIVVATSTPSHWSVIKEVLEKTSVKMILCEKPLANKFSDALSITKACEAKNVSLFVNFIRRAEPSVIAVRNSIIDGKLKPPFVGRVNYSKGLFNTASHFTDLIEFWFGAPVAVDNTINSQPTKLMDDFCLDFQVEFLEGHITFHSMPFDRIATFDLEIVFNNGRLNYTKDNRIFWYKSTSDDGKVSLDNSEINFVEFPNEMNMYQKNMVCELYKALTGRPHFLCPGKTALKWNREFEKILISKGYYL